MNSAATSHGKGPKSTPLLAGGRLYTLGISGVLSALDAATGKVAWRHAFDKEFGPPPDFGTATSPLFDNGLVIAHVGGINAGALRAFDPATGATKWSWTGDGPGYASPVSFTAAGVRQIVDVSKTKVVGVDAASGALLWSLPLVTPYDQNAVTPADRRRSGDPRRPRSGDVRDPAGARRRRQVEPRRGCGTPRRSRCT